MLNNNINNAFKNIEDNILNSCCSGLEKVLLSIAEESVKICPKRTGELRESLGVSLQNTKIAKGTEDGTLNISNSNIKNSNEKINGEIIYNHKHSICHEWDDTETHWTTPNTHSKFLENPTYNADIENLFLSGFLKEIQK